MIRTPLALKVWRKELKLSQMNMALKLCISLSTYKRIESGNTLIPPNHFLLINLVQQALENNLPIPQYSGVDFNDL